MMTVVREARLRADFAHLYPELPAGRWLPATEVGAIILMSQLRATRPQRLGERLLPDEHFDFRGGDGRGNKSALRTRRGEPGTAQHQH